MNKALKYGTAVSLAMALASSAHANTFSGTVSFGLSTLPALVASGTGSGRSRVVPNVFSIRTPAWAATGPTLIMLPPTAAAPISRLQASLVAPGPCSFDDVPGNVLGGPCALGGVWSAWVAGRPFLVLPLSALGVAGRVSFGPYGSYIDAQSWTTGTAVVTVNGVALTANGVPIVSKGSDRRTTMSGSHLGSGHLKLVAPAGLMSTLGGNLPLYVSMSVFVGPVPEPGTLLLLGSGIVGLAAIGRKRMRR